MNEVKIRERQPHFRESSSEYGAHTGFWVFCVRLKISLPKPDQRQSFELSVTSMQTVYIRLVYVHNVIKWNATLWIASHFACLPAIGARKSRAMQTVLFIWMTRERFGHGKLHFIVITEWLHLVSFNIFAGRYISTRMDLHQRRNRWFRLRRKILCSRYLHK